MDDRTRWKRAEILKLQEDTCRKYEKYWQQYQEVGNSSSKRTADKYEQLAEICGLALQALSETCDLCSRRHRNGIHAIKNLHERKTLGETSIPIEEAADMISILTAYAIPEDIQESNQGKEETA